MKPLIPDSVIERMYADAWLLLVGVSHPLNTTIELENAHLSNEKKPSWLGCIGDEILPS